MKLFFILALLIYFSSLLAGELSQSKTSKLLGILPAKASQKQILEMFGKPNKIVDLKSLNGASKNSGILWEYFDGDGVSFSFTLDGKEQTPTNWTWTILQDDPEHDLKTALSRFQGASWKAETVKWVNPHQIPMECYFRDDKQGVLISYNRARKEVTAISRWNPSRGLSSSEEEKPPRYCIGRGCVDAKLSSEVFKDSPLCLLPKE
jgi:hypothetical protein